MPSKMVHIGEKRPNSEPKLCAALKTGVVDVGGDQGGGAVHGGPHVLRHVIDFRSAMLCIKIGNRFPM